MPTYTWYENITIPARPENNIDKTAVTTRTTERKQNTNNERKSARLITIFRRDGSGGNGGTGR